MDFLPDPLPALLMIDEVARVLRIGRSHAYAMAHEYLNTGGKSGLPVLQFGSSLRVPSWAVVELVINGRIVRLGDGPAGE